MPDSLLSIVVPTRGRLSALLRLTHSIQQTNYIQHGCDVHIVLDRARYDSATLSRISAIPRFHLHRSPGQGPAAARNLGVARTNSRFVAFIDDDCVLPPSFLNDLGVALLDASPHVIALGGAIRPLATACPSQTGRYLSAIQHLNGPITSGGRIASMASANLCVDTLTFHHANRFDERFTWAGGEDQHLLSRLTRLGELAFTSRFFVYHDHSVTLAAFVGKFFRYGRGVSLNDHLTGGRYPLDSTYRPIEVHKFWLPQVFNVFRTNVRRTLRTIRQEDRRGNFAVLATLQELSFQAGYTFETARQSARRNG